MAYDPFSPRNLVPAFAVVGLVVMMSEVAPKEVCIAVGLACLIGSGVSSLFTGGKRLPKTLPPKTAPPKTAPPQTTPQQAALAPPQQVVPMLLLSDAGVRHAADADEGIAAHPAIFAGISSRSRRR